MKKKIKITLYVLSGIIVIGAVVSAVIFIPMFAQEEINLISLSETDMDGNTFIIEVQGDFAYTLNLDNSYFKVTNISDPNSPQILGSLQLNGTTHDMQIVGNRSYIASRYAGLHIINIEDPSSPLKVGFFASDSIEAIHICDSIAYIGSHFDYLQIVNISDEANPVEISFSLVFEHDIHGMGRIGNNLLATGSDGLFILNITNSTNPSLVNHFSGIGGFSHFVLHGDYMVIPIWNQGLRVLNISDLENIEETSSSYETTTPVDVEFIGYYAFISASSDGILVYDIEDPSQLVYKMKCGHSLKYYNNLVIRDNLLYSAAGTHGIEIFQIEIE